MKVRLKTPETWDAEQFDAFNATQPAFLEFHPDQRLVGGRWGKFRAQDGEVQWVKHGDWILTDDTENPTPPFIERYAVPDDIFRDLYEEVPSEGP